jgi:hypothetical protein
MRVFLLRSRTCFQNFYGNAPNPPIVQYTRFNTPDPFKLNGTRAIPFNVTVHPSLNVHLPPESRSALDEAGGSR